MPSANRIAKETLVGELRGEFGAAQSAVLARTTGITVEAVTELRLELRKKNVSLRVIKNSLARKVIEGSSLEALTPSLKGPTALAFTETDPVSMAKILTEFAKKQEGKFSIEVGVLSGKLLSKNEVTALANVPPREVLLGRLVGSLQSPYARVVYTLSGVLRKAVYALDAVRRKKEAEGK